MYLWKGLMQKPTQQECSPLDGCNLTTNRPSLEWSLWEASCVPVLKLHLCVQCAIVNTPLKGLQGVLGLEGGTRTLE